MDKPGRGCDEAAGPTWPSVDSALAPRLTSVIVLDPSELPPLHPGSGPQRPSRTCLHERHSTSVWLLSPPPRACGRQLPSSRALPRARSQARHPTHSLTFMGHREGSLSILIVQNRKPGLRTQTAGLLAHLERLPEPAVWPAKRDPGWGCAV